MDVDAIQPIGPIAEWLGITHQTLYRWTKQGLPHFRIGSRGRRQSDSLSAGEQGIRRGEHERDLDPLNTC